MTNCLTDIRVKQEHCTRNTIGLNWSHHGPHIVRPSTASSDAGVGRRSTRARDCTARRGVLHECQMDLVSLPARCLGEKRANNIFFLDAHVDTSLSREAWREYNWTADCSRRRTGRDCEPRAEPFLSFAVLSCKKNQTWTHINNEPNYITLKTKPK